MAFVDKIEADTSFEGLRQLAREILKGLNLAIKENAAVLKALKRVEFDARGYCLACDGWDVGPTGATPNVHRKDCPVGNALAGKMSTTLSVDSVLSSELMTLSKEINWTYIRTALVNANGYSLADRVKRLEELLLNIGQAST